MINIEKVELIQMEQKAYPKNSPFSPPEIYPERLYEDIDETNSVYKAVRDLLTKLELDKENYGNKKWNPLGEIIKPGDKVVIKPNFVSESRSEDIEPLSIVTHASVIRPIIDYCQIALQGKGIITVADAPQEDSDFEKIKDITGIKGVIDFINDNSSLKVNLFDLRERIVHVEDNVITKRFKNDGNQYTTIDIGKKSEFICIDNCMDRIYGADYDYEEVRKHHTYGKHEYYISNIILDADVIINIPKLKTHKKSGITVCLKSLIGINGNKNYLPHFRFGSKEDGGDEHPNGITQKFGSNFYKHIFKTMSLMGPTDLMRIPGKIYHFLNKNKIVEYNPGNWNGNDTIWRTIIDLNKIIFYADKNGIMRDNIQRKYFAIVDGVIAGEGNGPHYPKSKSCGLIFGGFDPVLIDLIAAKIMGFDWQKIPLLVNGKNSIFPNNYQCVDKININLNFQPPPMWETIK